jgi:diguanylate cyclase (GGDEF)-like protein
MRQWGIKRRVLVLALVPAALIAAMLAFSFIQSGIRDLNLSLRERGLAIARQLAPASEYGVFSGNREILQSLAQSTMREADVKAVVVADSRGKVLAVSGRPGIPVAAMAGVDGTPQVIASSGDSLAFTAPIFQSEINVDDFSLAAFGEAEAVKERKMLGWVSVELSTRDTANRQKRLVMSSLLIALLGLTVTALFALRLSRDVTRPILRLAAAVRLLADGRLDTRVESSSPGEIGDLEEGINIMAANLKAAQENLQERIDEATALLSHQASHDVLTGLVNRREFEKRMERALRNAREQGGSHVLCYMDLDRFKIVNDTCGHVAGDELLRQLSFLMRKRLRDRDTLARLGGDEFGLLLEGCSQEDALRVAEDLLEMVRDFRFTWQDKVFNVGVSMGLVALGGQNDSIAGLLTAADAACYAAKEKGRNRIHVYQETDADLVQRSGEMQWVSRINQALEKNQFLLYRQPIASLKGVKETAFEVLLRMKDENGEIVPPMAFIPAAERYGLMPEIDRWVIHAAFDAIRRLGGDGKGTCAINLSSSSLLDPGLADYVRDGLRRYGLSSQCICFEISEVAAIANLSETLPLLQELKKMGCRLSLDDFGSGMSSFAYLRNLPVDYLKIDGSFVRNMAVAKVDFMTVQSIHNIAAAMGIRTMAEWVEDEETLLRLREIGVDYAQGYWLGRPEPL